MTTTNYVIEFKGKYWSGKGFVENPYEAKMFVTIFGAEFEIEKQEIVEEVNIIDAIYIFR